MIICWNVVTPIVRANKVARHFIRHHFGVGHRTAKTLLFTTKLVCVTVGIGILAIPPILSHGEVPPTQIQEYLPPVEWNFPPETFITPLSPPEGYTGPYNPYGPCGQDCCPIVKTAEPSGIVVLAIGLLGLLTLTRKCNNVS